MIAVWLISNFGICSSVQAVKIQFQCLGMAFIMPTTSRVEIADPTRELQAKQCKGWDFFNAIFVEKHLVNILRKQVAKMMVIAAAAAE